MDSDVILDSSISFGRRTTTRLPTDPSLLSEHEREEENFDFLALITAIAELYSQEDVLEMQGRREMGKYLGRGAVSEVSTVYAGFTRPSAIISTGIKRDRRVVVIKQSESKLFLPNGQRNNTSAIKSFISEIRILSHKELRQHANIVKILGIHWDYFNTGYPQPLILIEKANTDLQKFQVKRASLPFATKKSIALDIARGLSALHQCGIIHGDIKPENVLIFYKPELHAKIADFSHSFLDTGHTRRLVGGSHVYAAPEWKTSRPTGELLKTDIYSFGLIFSGLVTGLDLVNNNFANNRCFGYKPELTQEEALQKLKNDDMMRIYIYDLIIEAAQIRPDLHLEELPMIQAVLEATLRLDPKKRDLGKVIEYLSGSASKDGRKLQKIEEYLAATAISIPYHALQSVSNVVMDQIVRALKLVATSRNDTRRAAACMELATCYACGFATEYDSSENIINSSYITLEHIVKAAEQGDIWAKATAYGVSQAMQMNIPANYPTRLWLFDAASQGSSIALKSLKQLDIALHKKALIQYRSTFCGNSTQYFTSLNHTVKRDPCATMTERGDTFLHWIASTGQLRELDFFLANPLANDVINGQNKEGDTPLLCATRAGHHEILIKLVARNADASIQNAAGENSLHFLGSLDDDQIPVAAQLLVAAGAVINAEAKGYTGNTYLQAKPTGKGCPKLRAVMLDQPQVLKALLGLTAYQHSLDHRSQYATTASTQRLMIAWALRLRHHRILEVLQEYFCTSSVYQDVSQIRIWNNGSRYSLLELCVLGNVSGNATSGFDVPDKFWRYINHGDHYKICLERSLTFLSNHDRQDIQDLFLRIHKERLLEQRLFEQRILEQQKANNQLRRFVDSSLNFLDQIDQATYAIESPEAYTQNPFSTRRLRQKRQQQQQKRIKRRQRFQMYSVSIDLSDSAVSESSEDEEESVASDPEPEENEERGYSWSSRPDCRRDSQISDNVTRNESNSLPLDHYRMEGLVDAILLAILCGHRGIFHELTSGPGCTTLIRVPSTACWVFTGSDFRETAEARKDQHKAYDLRSWFPKHIWKDYFIASIPFTPNHSLEFDGNLCYPLLYMTVVARSTHRDISLAKILLSVMKKFDAPQPLNWTAQNWFEDACLSVDSSSGQTSSLFHAAALCWDELSILLMENGASPQGVCFLKTSESTRPFRGTVLSRIIGSTLNANNEVHDLLRGAASQKLDCIITLTDINAIVMLQTAHPGRHIKWGSSGKDTLTWSRHLLWRPDRDMQLWQSIAFANISQRQKINDPNLRSTLIKEVTWRRDIWAVRTLLDIGLDPNGYRGRWRFWKLQLTALDFVAWTEVVDRANCDESGLVLGATDAEIMDLLQSRGGTRGIDYNFEYQLFLALTQNFIIPVGGLFGLGFMTYISYPWIPKFWVRGLDLGREAWKDSKEADSLRVIYYTDRVGTLIWGLLFTLALLGPLELFPDAESHENISAIFGYSFLGIFAIGIKLVIAATQEDITKKVIFNSFQFDGALYLFVVSIIALNCFVISIPEYWFNGRVCWLSEEVQAKSNLGLVWKASYSPLTEVRRRISKLLWDFSIAIAQWSKVGKLQTYLYLKMKNGWSHLDTERGITISSNGPDVVEEDNHVAEDSYREYRFKDWAGRILNIPGWIRKILAVTRDLNFRERILWYAGSDELIVEDDEDVRLLEDFDG